MNLWQTATLILAAGAGGWLACDATKAKQLERSQASLQQSMREYAGAIADAQRQEAQRIIVAVQEAAQVRAENTNQVNTIIREVQSAPITQACVDSPAVRVALAGLRKLAEAPAPGDPDGSAAP